MKTGIVFNDEMDDFSSPAFENDWDVQVICSDFLNSIINYDSELWLIIKFKFKSSHLKSILSNRKNEWFHQWHQQLLLTQKLVDLFCRLVALVVPESPVEFYKERITTSGLTGSKRFLIHQKVILNKLKFKMNNNEAVQFNRIHHQLSPNRLEYQGMTHVLWLIHWKLGLLF